MRGGRGEREMREKLKSRENLWDMISAIPHEREVLR